MAVLRWTAASQPGVAVQSYKPRRGGQVLATLGPGVLSYADPGMSGTYDVLVTFADGSTVTSAPKVYANPGAAPGAMPKQGISTGYTILNRTSAGMDEELDNVVEVANGKPCFVRLDSVNATSEQNKLDVLMPKVLARGLTPLLILWGSVNAPLTPGTFAADQVAKWGTACNHYEVCNEPDLHLWTPNAYADFVAAVGPQVHATPGKRVIAGALWKGDNRTPVVPPQEFATALATRAAGHFDYLSGHLYDNPYSRGTWNIWDMFFPAINGVTSSYPTNNVRTILDSAGLANVGIMSTENGGKYNVDFAPSSAGQYTESQVADFVSRAFDLVAAGLLATHLVYAMRNDSVAGFGMLRSDLTQRPAYTVFRDRAVS